MKEYNDIPIGESDMEHLSLFIQKSSTSNDYTSKTSLDDLKELIEGICALKPDCFSCFLIGRCYYTQNRFYNPLMRAEFINYVENIYNKEIWRLIK